MTIAIQDTTIHHAQKKALLALEAVFAAEYPALMLWVSYNEDYSRVSMIRVIHSEPANVDDIAETIVSETDKAPKLADILDACAERGLDPEIGADEDDGPSGSVVDSIYRQQYREQSSTKQSCGDWLAEQLAIDTHSAEGFVAADFEEVLRRNAVDQSGRWARLPESGQKGWVGRWRMNGRQALEKAVVLSGKYVDVIGNSHDPDATWLATKRARHAKWIAKQQRAQEAADALAE